MGSIHDYCKYVPIQEKGWIMLIVHLFFYPNVLLWLKSFFISPQDRGECKQIIEAETAIRCEEKKAL